MGTAADDAIARGERDRETLETLLFAYGPHLGITRGVSTESRAVRLCELGDRVGAQLKRGTVLAILRGIPQKRPRSPIHYEGLSRVFAALDQRLIIDEQFPPNCFAMAEHALKSITTSFKEALPSPAQLDEKCRAIRKRYDPNETGLSPDLYSDDPGSNDYAGTIFENWRRTTKRGTKLLGSGIYQVFRRYKPERRETQESKTGNERRYDWSDPTNHVVIIELLFVDSVALECIMITAEGDKCIGTLNINSANVLFAVLQRWQEGDEALRHRMICVTLVSNDLPFFSGLSLKIGDRTGNPVASECVFVPLEPNKHRAVYKAFLQLRKNLGDPTERIAKNSMIYQYITASPPVSFYDPANPPKEWKRVKFVRDFPDWRNLVREQKNGKGTFVYFREPSRALKSSTIRTELVRDRKIKFEVFRWPSSKRRKAVEVTQHPKSQQPRKKPTR
jgi:hypothetical protein